MATRLSYLCIAALLMIWGPLAQPCSADQAGRNDAAKPFKVGVIAPLTGRVAIVGESLRNAIILEGEESLDKDRVSFLFEDDQYLPKDSVSAAKKLIHVDQVDALVVFGSGPSLAVAEISSKVGIPLIAMAFSSELTEKFDHVVRIFLSVDQQIELIFSEMSKRGYPTVALATTTLEATQAARRKFIANSKIPVAFEEEILPSDFDLRMTAAKIRSKQPAATMLMLFPPQIALLARTLRSEKYTGAFFGLSFMLNPDEIAAAQGALEGAWAVGIDDRLAAPFVKRYQHRFNEEPWHDGAIGYDIAALLRKVGAAGIEGHLDKIDAFTGVYGVYRKTRRHDFEPPAAIKHIKNGRAVIP